MSDDELEEDDEENIDPLEKRLLLMLAKNTKIDHDILLNG